MGLPTRAANASPATGILLKLKEVCSKAVGDWVPCGSALAAADIR